MRAKRRRALAKLDTLTQSLFLEMFGDFTEVPPDRQLVLRESIDPTRPICYGILMPGEPQNGGISYIQVVDMRDGGVETHAVRKTTQVSSDQYKRSLLRTGDILLSIRGHVGRIAEVPDQLNGANITQDTARLAVTAANPTFIRELLRTPSYQRWMERHTKGVAVRGLNLGDLKVLPLRLPDIRSHRRFENAARKADQQRNTTRESDRNAQSLFQALQHRAFRGDL